MAATRFTAASRHGKDSHGRLPQLTPTFSVGLRLAREQRCNVAGIDFGETAVFAMYLSAGECSIAGSDELADSLMLIFNVDGEMILQDGTADRPVCASRGDVWAFGRSSSFDIEVTADVQMVAVTLPVQVLQEFGIDEQHTLRALDPNSTLLSPALGFLREIAVQDGEVPSIAAYFMERLVHEMVGGIMLENRGAKFTSAPRKGFFDQAMDYIAARAGDVSLTPATLAEELSLSLRQLQREFKRNNVSIAAVVLEHRTNLAVRLLQDPKMNVLTLDKIAEYSGFSSSVQLRRALKDAHAASPSVIRSRAASQRQTRKPDAKQSVR